MKQRYPDKHSLFLYASCLGHDQQMLLQQQQQQQQQMQVQQQQQFSQQQSFHQSAAFQRKYGYTYCNISNIVFGGVVKDFVQVFTKR